jgi:hypothetical protein
MPKTRCHNPSREQFWWDTISAWKASGQSVRAFCAARGLNEATFYPPAAGTCSPGATHDFRHPFGTLANVRRGSRRP